ncbi:MAG TPA: hypothetical protein VID94_08360 [Acidimicrobiales bacterium]
MNRSKAKGTAYENELLADLRKIWPAADRAKAGNESCDFVGIPFPIEAKHRKAWDLRTWIRKIRKVSTDGCWAIFAADGDRRLATSIGDVMVVDREFGMMLLEAGQRVIELYPVAE